MNSFDSRANTQCNRAVHMEQSPSCGNKQRTEALAAANRGMAHGGI
jgi:uncharacterized protein YbbK (DUF523 family)